jgi:hypothetical protein
VVQRPSQPPIWLFSVGLALAYLASLSLIFVQEAERPGPFVMVFFLPAVFAGLLIGRLWALTLPLGVLAISLVWAGLAEEDVPLILVIGGVLTGAALSRAYAHASRDRTAASADAPAHRWTGAKTILRRVVTREALDDVLDRVRFRIDTFPEGLYQPVPSLPARASRGTGSESRWSALLPIIEEQDVGSAVDIGACEGYFSLNLAAAGVPTIAVESVPRNYRTALLAVRRSGTSDVGVLAMEVTPENAGTLPATDCVLCLSVWHHFVRAYGLADATDMLAAIWRQTRKVMFFDTGENEMTPDYGLPAMTPDARSWLAAYLEETCPGSRAEHLGRHRAFDPSGNPCERNLFAVFRTSEHG